MSKTHFLVRVALIAAIYTTINMLFAPISYGPIQVRIAESLTVLSFIDHAAIGGLFLGCIAGNLWGGLGIIDILGGSICTLIAAVLTYKMKKPVLAPLPPVVINSLGVSLYLHILFKMPYWLTVSYIFLGQFVSCYLLGYPLLLVLLKRTVWSYSKK